MTLSNPKDEFHRIMGPGWFVFFLRGLESKGTVAMGHRMQQQPPPEPERDDEELLTLLLALAVN